MVWPHPRDVILYAISLPFKTRLTSVTSQSDMDSENLSSLIQLSVSDGQKTDSSKVVSVIGI